jgi:hypothetical protein
MSRRHQCPTCDKWTNERGLCEDCKAESAEVKRILALPSPACGRMAGCITAYKCTRQGECVHLLPVHGEV